MAVYKHEFSWIYVRKVFSKKFIVHTGLCLVCLLQSGQKTKKTRKKKEKKITIWTFNGDFDRIYFFDKLEIPFLVNMDIFLLEKKSILHIFSLYFRQKKNLKKNFLGFFFQFFRWDFLEDIISTN